jgi:hypothetical protein
MGKEIIDIALENLSNTTGITGHWDPEGPLDGRITLEINGQVHDFVVELKKELRQHQLQQIEYIHAQYENMILIAEHLFPKVKNQLRQKGLPYLEANGNVYLKKGDVYCFIDTNKAAIRKKETGNRVFTKTGLKVLFHFLLDKDLVNTTQRQIAETTMVGLGNIPLIINGLKDLGYLIPLRKNEFLWEKRGELLERWINEYATTLRPKLTLKRYVIPDDWRKIELNNELTVWGGEPAADILTNHLRPGKYILYTNESNVNLIKNYRIIPDESGELEVLKLFWNNAYENNIAPPILVYAELTLEGGKRNMETAKIIYDKFILPKL